MKPFKSVEVNRPRRSVFDLSYSKVLDASMGILYPVMADEMVPGDKFIVDNEIVVRAMPLTNPMLHAVWITVHYFFVPYRLLWSSWEDFITGGTLGTDASSIPRQPVPTVAEDAAGNLIWDYLGYPKVALDATTLDNCPIYFPTYAYNMIFNEYYRDQTLVSEVALTNHSLLRRAWQKDYFTSALLWAQRGTAPAFPITGNVTFDFSVLDSSGYNGDIGGGRHSTWLAYENVSNTVYAQADHTGTNAQWNTDGFTELNTTSFDINDVRLAFQIQRWMERNARCGVRYTEFLQAHYGVGGNLDARLQRPEYVGGSKQPLIVSEVLQTSESGTTPQGTMAGHGISVGRTHAGKYYAQEFGVMMGIMSIMPETMYHQGVNRQWLRKTRYDFYNPLFAHLGEQLVTRAELYFTTDEEDNDEPFGFQGRYDEMRTKDNMVVGHMRPDEDLGTWTLCRNFGSAPTLDSSFVQCNPDARAWAAPNEPQFVVNFGNRIKAIRPLPSMGVPGYTDH